MSKPIKFRIVHEISVDSFGKETSTYTVQEYTSSRLWGESTRGITDKRFDYRTDRFRYYGTYPTEQEAQESIEIQEKIHNLDGTTAFIYPEVRANVKFENKETQALYEKSIKSLNAIRKTLQELQNDQ